MSGKEREFLLLKTLYFQCMCTTVAYTRVYTGRGMRFVSFPNHPEQLWGHKAFHLMSTCFSSLGQNWTGRETDHLPPFNAKVANEWSYTSSPPYVPSLRGQVWVKIKVKFILEQATKAQRGSRSIVLLFL
jgi:hypothetical protein